MRSYSSRVLALTLLTTTAVLLCGSASAAITVDSFTASPGSWVGLCNNAILLQANAPKGPVETTYQFSWTKNPSGPSGDSGGFITSSAWNWTPQWTGQYTLTVRARQGTKEATKQLQYVVAFPPVTITVSPTSNVTMATSVTASVVPPASCVYGKDIIKYKFLSNRQLPSGSWVGYRLLADWNTSPTITFQPDGDGSVVVQARAGILAGTQVLTEGARTSDAFAVSTPLPLNIAVWDERLGQYSGVQNPQQTEPFQAMGPPPGSSFGPIPLLIRVRLDRPALPTGMTYPFSSSDPARVTVQSSITIPVGQSEQWIHGQLNPFSVATDTPVILTYGSGSTAKTNTITLKAFVLGVSHLRFEIVPKNPAIGAIQTVTVVQDGQMVEGIVDLNGAASADYTVPLTSSDNSVSVPPSALIPAGPYYGRASFPVTTQAVATQKVVTITAGSKSATLTIYPPSFKSFALAATSVAGGTATTGTITLGSIAPSQGSSFTVSSSDAAAAVPATGNVTVPAGQTTATFTINTSSVTADRTVAIIVTGWGGSKQIFLTVRKPSSSL